MLIDQHEKGKKEVFASSTDKTVGGQLAKTPFIGVYHLKIIFRMPGIESFKINAILDTEATKCCIDTKSVRAEALEDNKWPITIWGVASQTITTKKLKDGYMTVGGNHFSIPFTYSMDMKVVNGIQMLLG